MRHLIPLMTLLFASAASAQLDPDFTQFPTPSVGKLQPVSGAWYNPAAPGTGYMFDFGPDGVWFAAIFVYSPTGAPTFYTVQGNYAETSDAERLATGIIGRITSPLFASEGGQCLGCPYSAPRTTDGGLGQAEFVFFSATDGELRLGSFVQSLKAYQLLVTQQSSLPERSPIGRWMGAFKGTLFETIIGVNIVAQPTATYVPNPLSEPGALQGPAPFSVQFRIQCGSFCAGVVTANGRQMAGTELGDFENQVEMVLSFDPTSRRFAAHQIQPDDGTLVKRFEVQLRNNGRELYLRAPSYTSVVTGSFIGVQEFLLTKLPDDFRPRSARDGV